MKTIKVKLTLCENAMNHLSTYPSAGIEVSDIINKLFTPRENNKDLSANSKHTILTRAYRYHASVINLSYTKYEFFERFKDDKKFEKLYVKYVKLRYDKNLRPSFVKSTKLDDVKVTTYEKNMLAKNTKAIQYTYMGKRKQYHSISKAVKDTGFSRAYIQKLLALDTKDGYQKFEYM